MTKNAILNLLHVTFIYYLRLNKLMLSIFRHIDILRRLWLWKQMVNLLIKAYCYILECCTLFLHPEFVQVRLYIHLSQRASNKIFVLFSYTIYCTDCGETTNSSLLSHLKPETWNYIVTTHKYLIFVINREIKYPRKYL